MRLLFIGVVLAASLATGSVVDATTTSRDAQDSIHSELAAQQHCLAEAIYFEGRNQSLHGMAAIGQVIINRVLSPEFPDTICDVVRQGPADGAEITRHRCQFSYYCDGKSDEFPVNDDYPEVIAAYDAKLVADILLNDGITDRTVGSTYYHTNYVAPYWADEFVQVAKIGDHLFYTPE